MMLSRALWSCVALDALMFVVLLAMTLLASGHNDGGREMAIAFYIVLPALVVALAVLLHVLCTHPVGRSLALLVVAAPLLTLAMAQLTRTCIRSQKLPWRLRHESKTAIGLECAAPQAARRG